MKKKWIKIYDRMHPFDVVEFPGVETLYDVLEKFSKPNETKIKWISQDTGMIHRNAFKCVARNDRYVIWTKPYNARKTSFYTIFDLEEMECATDNLIFGIYDYDDKEDCEEALKELQEGRLELSWRRKAKIESCVAEVWILAEEC